MRTMRTMLRWSGFLALAMALGPSTQVNAGFSLLTTAYGVSYSGGSLTQTTLSAGEVINIGAGSFTVGSAGGNAYTDSAGTTIYLIDDARSATSEAIPNEQIFVANSTSGATDTGTFTFSTDIAVTNNGSTGNFTEGPSNVALDLTGGNANYVVMTAGVSPGRLLIGGDVFSASLPQAVSGDINSEDNGGVSAVITDLATVPEPASIAMLGLGAIGVAGLMVCQRRASK